MMWKLSVKYEQEELLGQKCCLPVNALRSSNIRIGDFAAINFERELYFCRVYPHYRSENCAVVDYSVSCRSFSETNFYSKEKILNFPENFTCEKQGIFEKLQIKLVLLDNTECIDFNIERFCSISYRLLQNYVVWKNAVIKFSVQKLADLFKIHSIIICETFPETKVYGRISQTSSIEIIGFEYFEQTKLLKQFSNLPLCGVDHVMELLKINTEVCKRILVLGPPGWGKTTLIKKFCCDSNCFTIVIDDNSDFTLEKCNLYCDQLRSISKVFPDSFSIIFIDNIDKVAGKNSKLTGLSDKSKILLKILNELDAFNVLIIAATTHKELINPDVSEMFESEIFLGVPSFEQRKEILKVLLRQLKHNFTDCTEIAQKTPGFLAYDLSMLVGGLQKENHIFENADSEILTMNDFDKILATFSPSLLRTSKWKLKVKPIYWKDIGGMKNIKESLQMCVEKPLLNPEVFKKVDLPIIRGVLLFGPPGCCKTTIARGLATECNANFFVANPSQIYSPFVGESEKNIAELFYEARLSTPSLIFLDELDCLVGRREFDNKSVGVAEKVLSTLLIEMDGFGVTSAYGSNKNPQDVLSYDESYLNDDARNERMKEQVIVVAATNRPDLIDNALLRPGRFDMILYVPPPNIEERESILRTLTAGAKIINVDFQKLAHLTENFSGADLKHLHSMAGYNALRENENDEYISMKDYLQALQDIRPSISPQQIRMYEKIASSYGLFISK